MYLLWLLVFDFHVFTSSSSISFISEISMVEMLWFLILTLPIRLIDITPLKLKNSWHHFTFSGILPYSLNSFYLPWGNLRWPCQWRTQNYGLVVWSAVELELKSRFLWLICRCSPYVLSRFLNVLSVFGFLCFKRKRIDKLFRFPVCYHLVFIGLWTCEMFMNVIICDKYDTLFDAFTCQKFVLSNCYCILIVKSTLTTLWSRFWSTVATNYAVY